ncbi:MAG: pyrroline-5-carboxylate reductase [Bdellovibrionales bacterium]|nr:pyrroline-5-carboxylate reductase [Bdellovibrionales bacterium]
MNEPTERTLVETKVAVIGCGAMGQALIRGFCRDRKLKPEHISVFDIGEQRLAEVRPLGVRIADSIAGAIEQAHIILLVVKPYAVANVVRALPDLRRGLLDSPLLVSVAAGVTVSSIQGFVGGPVQVARAMPNLACEIGQGMIALFAEDQTVLPNVERLFSLVGRTVCVQQEAELDCATALAGSGPAFAALFAEALTDGAILSGFPRDLAAVFAAQTLLGAAELFLKTGIRPAELKERVSSPGGTTIAGLHALEKGAVRGTIMTAVKAAADRAKELGS